jgi:hypothetical protein
MVEYAWSFVESAAILISCEATTWVRNEKNEGGRGEGISSAGTPLS